MNESEALELLYLVLLDIRELSREGDSRITRLTDAWHNLPLVLRNVRQGKRDEGELKDHCEERARLFGLEDWLKNHLENNLGR